MTLYRIEKRKFTGNGFKTQKLASSILSAKSPLLAINKAIKNDGRIPLGRNEVRDWQRSMASDSSDDSIEYRAVALY